MAAYAALVSLMNDIEQITSHPRLSSSLCDKQIQLLPEKAALLLAFIESYNHSGGSKEAEDLEREIAYVAREAEYVIESHIVDQIHTGANQGSELDLLQIIEDMDIIIKKAYNHEQFNEKSGLGGEDHHQPSQSTRHIMESTHDMVGFEGELNQLMDELTNERSSRHIISIVGMGGMGKTTLARKVFEILLTSKHFDFCAWATVSQLHNLQEILSQLLSGQGKSSSGSTVDGLGEQLHKTLWGRRYLIILDDVWSVEVWDEVSRFFPDNGNGSRVVLTTRLSNVAVDCGSSCLTKNLLDDNESWELFYKKAFPHGDCPPQLEKVGKGIVKLCKGLPLSIVVIGGHLLKSPRTVRYWADVANEIISIPDSEVKKESLDVLILSYKHLPPHLKPCFLYMGVLKMVSKIRPCFLYAIDLRMVSKIPVSKMIQLWVAEGFIKSNGDGRDLEEIAEDYLKDLIDRNLVLEDKLYDNGKIKYCDIHDLLRDLCIIVGKQQEFVNMTEEKWELTLRTTGSLYARSIVASIFPEQVLHKRTLLRILEVNSPNSQEELFEFVNLRYLAFNYGVFHCGEGHKMKQLSTSVIVPWNLQILIIKGACPLFKAVVAPTEIWKMQQLRHIECFQMYLPYPPCVSEGEVDEIVLLANLQTLKRAVNLRLSEDVCKMIPNLKKLNLAYGSLFPGYDDCLIECLCNLRRFHKLESLNLSIEIWGIKDSKLNKILTLPSSLNKLSLSLCRLHWEDLTMIGSLPQLQVLKLDIGSVTKGEEWSPIDGQFLQLRVLKIRTCDLVRWNAESCHFPILEKLLLRRMRRLEEIPSGIGEIPTLKLIRVEECSESVAISVMKIKEDDDLIQIQVVNTRGSRYSMHN